MKKPSLKKLMIKLAVPLGCGLFFYAILQFVFLIGLVPTNSMEPTIQEGSFIFACRMFSEPETNDIMVFEQDGFYLVKRVAAVPGDVVQISSSTGEVTVNGPLDGADQTLTVPSGHYFMLGDNSADSVDSRYWTEPFISREQLVAKVCGYDIVKS